MGPSDLSWIVLLVLTMVVAPIVLCRWFGILGLWWNSGHPSLVKKRPCPSCGTWSWIMRSRCLRCGSLFERVGHPISPTTKADPVASQPQVAVRSKSTLVPCPECKHLISPAARVVLNVGCRSNLNRVAGRQHQA